MPPGFTLIWGISSGKWTEEASSKPLAIALPYSLRDHSKDLTVYRDAVRPKI